MTTRRYFLSALVGLPLVGRLFRSGPVVDPTLSRADILTGGVDWARPGSDHTVYSEYDAVRRSITEVYYDPITRSVMVWRDGAWVKRS